MTRLIPRPDWTPVEALRETPGCGEDPECIVRHTLAVHHADECDPCLTRLAEAVLTHYGPRIMDMARRQNISHQADQPWPLTYPDWPSLLSALRSETPDEAESCS